MIRIDRPDWYRVRYWCDCGELVRTVVASTLAAAIWRFRLARKELGA